jgi:hypothetical protein
LFLLRKSIKDIGKDNHFRKSATKYPTGGSSDPELERTAFSATIPSFGYEKYLSKTSGNRCR